jgi:hypothetical protein
MHTPVRKSFLSFLPTSRSQKTYSFLSDPKTFSAKSTQNESFFFNDPSFTSPLLYNDGGGILNFSALSERGSSPSLSLSLSPTTRMEMTSSLPQPLTTTTNEVTTTPPHLSSSDNSSPYYTKQLEDGSLLYGKWIHHTKWVGARVWRDGSDYLGEFENDMANGYGVLRALNGIWFVFIFSFF